MHKRSTVFLFLLVSTQSFAQAQEKMSFDSAYRAILERSLRIQTQGYDVEISRQKRLQALGQFAPSVTIVGEQTQNTATLPGDPTIPLATSTTNSITGRSAAVTASLNLFRSGGDIAGAKAASRNVRSTRERSSLERQGVETDAVDALVNVIARAKEREITSKLLKVQDESMRVAKERFNKGYLPSQEVDKVAIELENARAQVTDAEVAESEARARLQALLGHDRIELEWPWRKSLTDSSGLDKLDFDLVKRPDWRAATTKLEAQAWSKRQSWSTLLPSLDLIGSYGNADLSQPERRDWSLGFTLTIPLFDRYTAWGNTQIQKLEESKAQTELESVIRTAPAEINALRANYRSSRDSALVREKTAKLSERVYGDNFLRFRLGRATVNELAIDQQRLLQSQLSEVQGWSTAHLSLMRLCHALGGFVVASGTCQESQAAD
jgi:outer membrane protein